MPERRLLVSLGISPCLDNTPRTIYPEWQPSGNAPSAGVKATPSPYIFFPVFLEYYAKYTCTADLMGKAWFFYENQCLKNSAEKKLWFPLRFDSILNRNLRLLNHVSPTSSYHYILKGLIENSTCPHLAPYPLFLSLNNSTIGVSCYINALCFLTQYMDQTAQGKA